MRELHHWLCLKERIHRFSPSSIPVSNKSPHCWTVWRGGACLWRYYKYYLFLCNIRGRSHPDRPPRTELQILGLKSPIHHPRLSWDACHWTCAWNRFITDQIEGEKKKYRFPFEEKETLCTIIEELISEKDGEVLLITRYSKLCGAYILDSIKDFNIYFDFEAEHSGLIVLRLADSSN